MDAQEKSHQRAKESYTLLRRLQNDGCSQAIVQLAMLQSKKVLNLHSRLDNTSFWMRFGVASEQAVEDIDSFRKIQKALTTSGCSGAMRSIQQELGP